MNRLNILLVCLFIFLVSPITNALVNYLFVQLGPLWDQLDLEDPTYLIGDDFFPGFIRDYYTGVSMGLIAVSLPIMLKFLLFKSYSPYAIAGICVALYSLQSLFGVAVSGDVRFALLWQLKYLLVLSFLSFFAVAAMKRMQLRVFEARVNPASGSRALLDLQSELTENIKAEIPKNRALAIMDLRARAQKLLGVSYIVLFVTVVVLGFAALFIVFAGEITKLGTVPIDPLRMAESSHIALESELDRTEERFLTVSAQLSRIEAESAGPAGTPRPEAGADSPAGAAAVGDAPSKSREAEQLSLPGRSPAESAIKTASANPVDLVGEQQLLRSKIETLNNRISESSQELRTLRAKVFEENQDGQHITDPSLLMTITVTRFGVLVIAIYLVQILINLYRYNTRLVAHYRATADSLLLLDHRHERIDGLHSSLWPDLDYGKSPKTLPQNLTDHLGKLSQAAVEAAAQRLNARTRTGAD